LNGARAGLNGGLWLLNEAADAVESFAGGLEIGIDVEGVLETVEGETEELLFEVDEAEVEPGQVEGVVMGGAGGLFEPGNGFVVTSQFDEAEPDVVVSDAAGGVKVDGTAGFGNGLLEEALEAEGSGEEGVGLGGGVEGDGLAAEVDGGVEVALLLKLAGAVQDFVREGGPVVIHPRPLYPNWAERGKRMS
jgi:hypothetical protein